MQSDDDTVLCSSRSDHVQYILFYGLRVSVILSKQWEEVELRETRALYTIFIPVIPCLFKDAQNMDAVMIRLRRLEDAQKATVDSCLEGFRHLIKSPLFTKDRALDRLLNLNMVAKEATHPKSGFFEAVFRALREKTGATDVQFTKYLEVLLGDNDHEKVLESIAKVEKAMRISSPPASRGFSYCRGAGRVNRYSVQCYYCYQFGHYQNSCPLRLPQRAGSGPPSKRGRFSEQLKK